MIMILALSFFALGFLTSIVMAIGVLDPEPKIFRLLFDLTHRWFADFPQLKTQMLENSRSMVLRKTVGTVGIQPHPVTHEGNHTSVIGI